MTAAGMVTSRVIRTWSENDTKTHSCSHNTETDTVKIKAITLGAAVGVGICR